MVYVSLSRVQSLSQLFILEKLPVEKVRPWMDAVEQMTRLDNLDEERRTNQNREIFLMSLNIYSIMAKYEDLKADLMLSRAKVLCLQETWLRPDRPASYDLTGFSAKHFNTVRRGAGIATYFNAPFSFVRDITAVS